MRTGSPMTIAVTIVRTWTRVYTWGTPSVWAEQRRADIESDLWEQQQDSNGGRGLSPAVHVLVRLFTGIADDLSWRVEHTTLQDNVLIRRAVTLAATTVALSVLWGSSGVAPRMAGCSGAPRKPKVEQVVAMRRRVLRVVASHSSRDPFRHAAFPAAISVETRSEQQDRLAFERVPAPRAARAAAARRARSGRTSSC